MNNPDIFDTMAVRCIGAADLLTHHAAALFTDGGPTSQQTGARIIATIDAGCS